MPAHNERNVPLGVRSVAKFAQASGSDCDHQGGPLALVMDQTCVDNTYKKEKKEIREGKVDGTVNSDNSAGLDKATRQHLPKSAGTRDTLEPIDGDRGTKDDTHKQRSLRISDEIGIADDEWEKGNSVNDEDSSTPAKRNRRRSSRPQGLRHEPDKDPDKIGVSFGRLEPLACKCVMQMHDLSLIHI